MTRKSESDELDLVARECIAVRLRLVNRVVSGVYDDALRPLDLKVSQMNILVVTAKLGVARPAEVCELLQIDVSTLSRNVERMRAREWLETVPDAGDARAQPFRITATGRKLLERAMPLWKQAQKSATELLGSEAVNTLARVAGTLRGRAARRLSAGG
jgi:DNA-binding MarR family transcriptional regulator